MCDFDFYSGVTGWTGDSGANFGKRRCANNKGTVSFYYVDTEVDIECCVLVVLGVPIEGPRDPCV